MMKVTWVKDEWWPVYTLEAPESFRDADEVEISPELYARYRNALTEWQSIQDELQRFLDPESS